MAGNASVDDPKDWVTVTPNTTSASTSANDPGDWQTVGGPGASGNPDMKYGPGWRFVGNAINSSGPGQVANALEHPIDTLSALPGALANKAGVEKAFKTAHDLNADLRTKAGAVLEALPLIGPALQQAQDQYDSGDHAGAFGALTGMLSGGLHPSEGTLGGRITSGALDRVGNKLTPKMAGLVNSYIGLQASDLPKYARATPGRASDIGATVYKEVGLQPSLEKMRGGIKDAMDRRTNETNALVHNAPGSIDTSNLFVHHGMNLAEDMARTGVTDDKFAALDRNLDGLLSEHGEPKTPAEALELRRALGSRIKDWDPATTNVESAYLQRVYHGLNDSIHDSLSPEAQAKFRENNRVVANLRTAHDAAGEKLLKEELEPGGLNLRSAVTAFRKGAVAGGTHLVDHIIPAGTQIRASLFPTQAAHAAASAVDTVDPFTGRTLVASPFIPHQAGSNGSSQ